MMMIWIEVVDDNGCLDSDCVALSKQQATQLKRKGGALIFTSWELISRDENGLRREEIRNQLYFIR